MTLNVKELYFIFYLFILNLPVNFVNFSVEELYTDQLNMYSIDFAFNTNFCFSRYGCISNP